MPTANRIRTHIGPWPYNDRTSSAHAAQRRLRSAPVTERIRVDHARSVWSLALIATGLDVAHYTQALPTGQVFGMADLAFLGEVGLHLTRCEQCWQGQRGMRPVDHLTWAVRQRRGLRQVWDPIAQEAALSRLMAGRSARL